MHVWCRRQAGASARGTRHESLQSRDVRMCLPLIALGFGAGGRLPETGRQLASEPESDAATASLPEMTSSSSAVMLF